VTIKRLILCSDGTGNSGGKARGTNVWRLFQAVAAQGDNGQGQVVAQLKIHDDGVGTDEFFVKRLMGAAFGYGISENLRQLYGFLLRHWEPGDEIYLFGFSRGAFTIRTLANMLYVCGLPDPAGKTPAELDRLAESALRAYKRRRINDPDHGRPAKFFQAEHGRRPTIHFIGVWDTVDAVGLPFEEMTEAFGLLFPLRFKKRCWWLRPWARLIGEQHEAWNRRENDLHAGIWTACQALSIDDARRTFHPLVWDPRLPGESPQPEVEQVWFAGTHSNVGGGYPKDHLALVSLTWIMDKAAQAGLDFDPELREMYRQSADPNGDYYDSRGGFAASLYRYGPRPIQELCAKAHAGQAKVHRAVLERIERQIDDYSPPLIPPQGEYQVIGGSSPEHNSAAREQHLKPVGDLIWTGRVVYYLMIIWVIGLAVWCYARSPTQLPDVAAWNPVSRMLYHVFEPLLQLASWLLPTYVERPAAALAHHPLSTGVWLLGYLALLRWSALIQRRIRDISSVAWRLSLLAPPAAAVLARNAPPPPSYRARRWLRTNPRIQRAADVFENRVVPIVMLAAILLLAGVFGWRISAGLLDHVCGQGCGSMAEAKEPRFDTPRIIEFATNEPFQATDVLLVEGHAYRIRVGESSSEPWYDANLQASPEGLKSVPETLSRFGFLRRDPRHPWFCLLGSIGPDDGRPLAIGAGTELQASTTGRLYLFVNDAHGYYENNRGKATVAVQRLPDAAH